MSTAERPMTFFQGLREISRLTGLTPLYLFKRMNEFGVKQIRLSWGYFDAHFDADFGMINLNPEINVEKRKKIIEARHGLKVTDPEAFALLLLHEFGHARDQKILMETDRGELERRAEAWAVAEFLKLRKQKEAHHGRN